MADSPSIPDSLTVNDAVKHKTYYSPSITFQVENALFRVPRYRLENLSKVFADMFLFPSDPNEAGKEGQSDDRPIILEGYTSQEFESLLAVIYPSEDVWGEERGVALSKEGWISVLKLSTIWEMDKIRRLAITELSKEDLDPIEKLRLAQAHRVKDWFSDALTTLTTVRKSLSLEDLVKEVGWETAARILWVRDTTRRREIPDWEVHIVSVPGKEEEEFLCYNCNGALHGGLVEKAKHFLKCGPKCDSENNPCIVTFNGRPKPSSAYAKPPATSGLIRQAFGPDIAIME